MMLRAYLRSKRGAKAPKARHLIVNRAMPLDLSDAEKAALVALLKATIAADRFPLSPRVRALRRFLDKLEPPSAGPDNTRLQSRRVSGARCCRKNAVIANRHLSPEQ
jgi:hypothetical protein